MTMDQRLSCLTLGVADLGRAVAFYEALESIVQSDQMEVQKGFTILQQLKKESYVGGTLISVYALYFLAVNNVTFEARSAIYDVVGVNYQLFDVLDAVAGCSRCVDKEGFMCNYLIFQINYKNN